MKVEQYTWTSVDGWMPQLRAADLARACGVVPLVLVFGATELLAEGEHLGEIRRAFPSGYIVGCSTAGEISGARVLDDSIVATVIHFEHTQLATAEIDLAETRGSFDAGMKLASRLDPHGLSHVLVISDGLNVNGSELVKGLVAALPSGVRVTGGLSADGARFQKTVVCCDSGAREKKVKVVGFYGNRLKIGCASMGGWDTFGPDRRVTRAKGNVLYELDGQPALDLYKTYLGEHAQGLPASGLLFPLCVRNAESTEGVVGVVRTILAVNEADGSMTFAGDIPEGSYARLMRANFDGLIDGAQGAAQATCGESGAGGGGGGGDLHAAQLAILISCVGRKLVLKQRVEEEVEAVQDVLGERAVLAGFYSYGEISPFTATARCELHNQTMTVTTFSER